MELSTGPYSDVDLEAHAARELTDKIRIGLEAVYQLIIQAYRGRAWISLGYSSWDSYVQREFGNLALRPPREERPEIIQSMRDAGMSYRAIGTATAMDPSTVHRSVTGSGVANATPDKTSSVGLDGKEYPAQSAPKAELEPVSTYEPSADTETELPELSEDEVEALLDAPATEAGIYPLDTESIAETKEAQTEKMLKEFHDEDTGALQRTMHLAAQVPSVISAVSDEVYIDQAEYQCLTSDVVSALRQFSYVTQCLAEASINFKNMNDLDEVIASLSDTVTDIRTAQHSFEEKRGGHQ